MKPRLTITCAIAFIGVVVFTTRDAAVTRAQNPPQGRGVISGIVRDELGRPVPGLSVSAGPRWVAGTDHRGEYQIGSLPDGEYVVSIGEVNFQLSRRLSDCIVVPPFDWGLPPENFVFGFVDPIRVVGGIASPPPEANGSTYSYVQSFAPGVVRQEDARRVEVRGGGAVRGVDIQLQLHPTATLVGRMAGVPRNVDVGLELQTQVGSRYTSANMDGTFVFHNAPVGPATLRSRGTAAGGCDYFTRLGPEYAGEGEVRIEVGRLNDVVFRLGEGSTVTPAPTLTVLPTPALVQDAATISGVATDDLNQPLDRVRVHVTSVADASERIAITGRDGRFSVTDLAPGMYTLVARRHGFLEHHYGRRHEREKETPVVLGPREHFSADLQLVRPGRVSGVVRDEAGRGIAGVYVQTRQQGAVTNDRGEYSLTFNPGSSSRTFYLWPPRQFAFELVQSTLRVDVKPAEDTVGVDFTMAARPSASPVVATPADTAAPVAMRIRFVGETRPMHSGLYWDLLKVTIDNPWQIIDRGPTGHFDFRASPYGNIELPIDKTEHLANISPGRYVLWSAGIPLWEARSAMVGDVDVLDHPFNVSADATTTIVVTVSDRETSLSGTVRGVNEIPISAATVVIASEDRQYWTAWSRRIRTTRPNSDGGFSFTRLPAGRYVLTVVDMIPHDQPLDPSFLERLLQNAPVVELTEGEEVRQDLQLRPRP